jgi:hypothetical protein
VPVGIPGCEKVRVMVGVIMADDDGIQTPEIHVTLK